MSSLSTNQNTGFCVLFIYQPEHRILCSPYLPTRTQDSVSSLSTNQNIGFCVLLSAANQSTGFYVLLSCTSQSEHTCSKVRRTQTHLLLLTASPVLTNQSSWDQIEEDTPGSLSSEWHRPMFGGQILGFWPKRTQTTKIRIYIYPFWCIKGKKKIRSQQRISEAVSVSSIVLSHFPFSSEQNILQRWRLSIIYSSNDPGSPPNSLAFLLLLTSQKCYIQHLTSVIS